MNWESVQPYVIPLGVAVFWVVRMLRFRAAKGALVTLKEQGAVIVDVRSSAEFATGANPLSINIPLDRLDAGAAKLDRSRPVVVCCASGMRSASAAAILKAKGFTQVVNAGPWRNTV